MPEACWCQQPDKWPWQRIEGSRALEDERSSKPLPAALSPRLLENQTKKLGL